MKIIALEEHFVDARVAEAAGPAARALSPDFAAAFDHERFSVYSPPPNLLGDLGETRLAAMDAGGITMQVLSCLSTQALPPQVAPGLARAANDAAAAAVAAHPDRFRAFAALPTTVPDAAADELRRCVGELGFLGTLIMGRTDGEFLDEPRFAPILAAAEELGVPIYLHPAPPPRSVTEACYAGGLDPLVTARFQTVAWGWHQETAVHFLHLVLSGVFDRYPRLQVILGHWGEMIPFYLERLDAALPRTITGLERDVVDYVRQNVFVTPGGMFNQAQLQFCVETIGVERILFAVDYPFVPNDGATAFLEQARLTEAEKEAIAHGNTEALLGIRV